MPYKIPHAFNLILSIFLSFIIQSLFIDNPTMTDYFIGTIYGLLGCYGYDFWQIYVNKR